MLLFLYFDGITKNLKKIFKTEQSHNMSAPSQQGMSGQYRADSDTTWQRRIAVGRTLARFLC